MPVTYVKTGGKDKDGRVVYAKYGGRGGGGRYVRRKTSGGTFAYRKIGGNQAIYEPGDVLVVTDLESDDMIALIILIGHLVGTKRNIHIHLSGAKISGKNVEDAKAWYGSHFNQLNKILTDIGYELTSAEPLTEWTCNDKPKITFSGSLTHPADEANVENERFSDVVAIGPMADLGMDVFKNKIASARIHIFHGFNWEMSFQNPVRFDNQSWGTEVRGPKNVFDNNIGDAVIAANETIGNNEFYITDKSWNPYQNMSQEFLGKFAFSDAVLAAYKSFSNIATGIFMKMIVLKQATDTTQAQKMSPVPEVLREFTTDDGKVKKFPALLYDMKLAYGIEDNLFSEMIRAGYASSMINDTIPDNVKVFIDKFTTQVKEGMERNPMQVSPAPGWADTMAVYTLMNPGVPGKAQVMTLEQLEYFAEKGILGAGVPRSRSASGGAKRSTRKTNTNKSMAKTKTSAKKTVAKKPVARKTVAKKPAAKKTAAKKTAAKKPVAKKK